MIERPILFSEPMVRAIREDRKTQTRRVIRYFDGSTYARSPDHVRWQSPRELRDDDPHAWRDKWFAYEAKSGASALPVYGVRCPYGVPGDRLWVRESWRPRHVGTARSGPEQGVLYRADSSYFRHGELRAYGVAPQWRPSIHMPRWASRITLEVTGVRVERLQEISRDDCVAEGIEPFDSGDAVEEESFDRAAYAELWDSINAERAPWASNPWVWVIEFRKLNG